MKKVITYLFLAIGTLAMAQEQENKKPDFGISSYLFNGNALLEQRSHVDQNSFIRDGVSLEFDIRWKGFGVFTGLGTYELHANRVIDGQSTFLKNQYLVIPFGITTTYPLFRKAGVDKLNFQLDFGGYAGHLLNSKEKTTDLTTIEKNVGWNFGFMGRIGVSYKMSNHLEIKGGLQAMSDLSRINTQKVTKSTMYFISVGYRF